MPRDRGSIKSVDTQSMWELIADQYRAGIPVPQIEKEFGVARSIIYTRMSRSGVKRSAAFKEAINVRTQEMLAEDAACADDAKKPGNKKSKRTRESAQKPRYNPLTEDTDRLVDAVASRAKDVISAHRIDIAMARTVYRDMLKKVKDAFGDEEVAKEEGLAGVKQKADALGAVVAAMEKVIKLERQAWNLGDDEDDGQKNEMAEIMDSLKSAPQNSIRTIIQMKRVGDVTFEAATEIEEDAAA